MSNPVALVREIFAEQAISHMKFLKVFAQKEGTREMKPVLPLLQLFCILGTSATNQKLSDFSCAFSNRIVGAHWQSLLLLFSASISYMEAKSFIQRSSLSIMS